MQYTSMNSTDCTNDEVNSSEVGFTYYANKCEEMEILIQIVR